MACAGRFDQSGHWRSVLKHSCSQERLEFAPARHRRRQMVDSLQSRCRRCRPRSNRSHRELSSLVSARAVEPGQVARSGVTQAPHPNQPQSRLRRCLTPNSLPQAPIPRRSGHAVRSEIAPGQHGSYSLADHQGHSRPRPAHAGAGRRLRRHRVGRGDKDRCRWSTSSSAPSPLEQNAIALRRSDRAAAIRFGVGRSGGASAVRSFKMTSLFPRRRRSHSTGLRRGGSAGWCGHQKEIDG